MLSITPQAPQQKIGPVGDDGTFTRPWYLFLTDVSKALADFIAGAVYGRPTLLHLNRVTKVTDSGTIGETAFLDTDVVTGAPTLTHVGRVTKVTAAGVIGEAAFLGTDVVLGAPTLTDVNRIPKVSAAGTLGESAVSDDGTTVTALARQMAITGTRPEYKATATGGTQPGRAGCLAGDGVYYVAMNLSFDGANWNLDDTGQPGLVIRLLGATVAGFKATAGANPRTLTQTFTFDDALVGFFGATAASKQTLNAYTTNDRSAAFTGIPASLAVAATLADLNTLRVAYENLRASYDDLRTKFKTTTLVA